MGAKELRCPWAKPCRGQLRSPRRCGMPLPTGYATRAGQTAARFPKLGLLLSGLCGAQLFLTALVTRSSLEVLPLPPLPTHIFPYFLGRVLCLHPLQSALVEPRAETLTPSSRVKQISPQPTLSPDCIKSSP